MKPEQQIPRNALVWMIISLFALVAPHAGRLPIWVLAVYVFAALWRTQVYRGRWSFPRWPVKLVLTGTATPTPRARVQNVYFHSDEHAVTDTRPGLWVVFFEGPPEGVLIQTE